MMDLLATPVSLKGRVLKGGAWSIAGYGCSQVLRLVSNLLLTRLLMPDAFALMAIASIAMVALTMFSDLGLKPVIIQNTRGNDAAFVNTAWTVQIIRGIVLWLVAFCIAGLLLFADRIGFFDRENVYGDPRLPYVIAALAFATLIAGFNSTKLAQASRRLALGRITLLDLTAQLIGLAVLFTWISFDRTIRALIVGNIIGALATMVLSHIWLPGTPNRWHWEQSALQEIISFGKWIFMSSILGFLVSSSDRLLLGGLIDKTTLGVYVIAYSIVGSLEAVLVRIIAGVTFPALSEIARERPATLRAIYYRIHLLISAFAYFCAGALWASGQSVVNFLYDPRYSQAGWMTEVLATILLATPFQIAIQGFVALGVPRLYSNILALRFVLLFVALPVGFHFFGLPGAIWGYVSSQLLCVPAIVFYSSRYELFDIRRELVSVPMALIGVAVGTLIAYTLKRFGLA